MSNSNCLIVSFLYLESLHYRENDKPNLFTDESVFPSIVKRKAEIEDVKRQLKDHRREIRLKLSQPSLDYVTVLQIEVRF